MENQVYVIYNKLSGRYEAVMSFPSDAIAIHRLSAQLDIEEYELCRVGSISIENGNISPTSPVRLVIQKNEVKPENAK